MSDDKENITDRRFSLPAGTYLADFASTAFELWRREWQAWYQLATKATSGDGVSAKEIAGEVAKRYQAAAMNSVELMTFPMAWQTRHDLQTLALSVDSDAEAVDPKALHLWTPLREDIVLGVRMVRSDPESSDMATLTEDHFTLERGADGYSIEVGLENAKELSPGSYVALIMLENAMPPRPLAQVIVTKLSVDGQQAS